VVCQDQLGSTAWDIWFLAYDARTNGGISGPGDAAVYPMYLETNNFDSVTVAPQGGGYFQDAFNSIFGSPTIPGSEWYDYNGETYEITSKEHVYVLKNRRVYALGGSCPSSSAFERRRSRLSS